jgi:hypothetical protein
MKKLLTTFLSFIIVNFAFSQIKATLQIADTSRAIKNAHAEVLVTKGAAQIGRAHV